MPSASPFTTAALARALGWLLLLLAVAGTVLASEPAAIAELKARSEAGDRNAARKLAEYYYLGRGGVAQDFTEAARWYEKLARQGDPRAQTSLGLMYARGYGVPRDMETARRWWTFAAAQNDPGAQYNLGVAYATGEGGVQDYAQAAQWLERAAQRGHVQAQHNLGMLYHEGRGVARDPVRAYFWLKVAALQGDDVSRDALGRASAGMTAEQIEAADLQAQAWMKRTKKLLN